MQLNRETGKHPQDSAGKIYLISAWFWEQARRDFPDRLGWVCRKGEQHFQNVRFLKGGKYCQWMFYLTGGKPRACDGDLEKGGPAPQRLCYWDSPHGGAGELQGQQVRLKSSWGLSGNLGKGIARGRARIISLNKPQMDTQANWLSTSTIL